MSIQRKQIYDMVKRIPRGRVATYGQIAALLGFPRHARQVGYALSALQNGDKVPWHRVVNAKGEISCRSRSGHEDFQRILLQQEGILFDKCGRIPMERFLWKPF